MKTLKSIARKIVFPVVTGMNLEKLFSYFANNNRLILCYHGVVNAPRHEVSLGPISVTQFEQHLQYFKHNFNVVSLEKLFEMYRHGVVPEKKTIALTFDDGYENNYTHAFPLLQQYGFQATFFVIGQSVTANDKLTWYDYFDFIKQELEIDKVDFGKLSMPRPGSLSQLRNYIKTLNIRQRTCLFTEFEKVMDVNRCISKYPRELWKLLDSNQIRILSESGLIEIGSHTLNHPNLEFLSEQDVRQEVKESKAQLEYVIKKEVRSIAFPDGSYNEIVKKICIEEGYTNLLAVGYKLPEDAGSKEILPRLGISSTTTFHSNMISVNRGFNSAGF